MTGEGGVDAALRDRVAEFERTGNRALIFDESAIVAAAQVISLVRTTDQPFGPAMLAIAGQLYWCRHLAGDHADDGGELNAARVLYHRAYTLDRQSTPEALWADLSDFDELNVTESLVSKTVLELCNTADELVSLGPDATFWLAQVFRAAAAMTPTSDPERPPLLGWIAVLNFRMGDQQAGLDQARRVAPMLTWGYEGTAWMPSQLGEILKQGFEQSGDRATLEAAIEVSRVAVRQAGDGDPFRAGALHNLSGLLLTRHALHRAELTTAHPDHDRNGYAEVDADADAGADAKLDAEAGAGAGADQADADLIEALDHSRAAVTAPGHDTRATFLLHAVGYAGALLTWVELTDDLDLLDEGEQALSYGLSNADPDHPHRPFALFRMGEIAARRYRSGGRDDYRDEANDWFCEVLRSVPAADPIYATAHQSLTAVNARRRR